MKDDSENRTHRFGLVCRLLLQLPTPAGALLSLSCNSAPGKQQPPPNHDHSRNGIVMSCGKLWGEGGGWVVVGGGEKLQVQLEVNKLKATKL